MCRLRYCCCCVELRTGAIVTAVLNFIGGWAISLPAINSLAQGVPLFLQPLDVIVGIALDILALVLLIGIIKEKLTLILVWVAAELVFLLVGTYYSWILK